MLTASGAAARRARGGLTILANRSATAAAALVAAILPILAAGLSWVDRLGQSRLFDRLGQSRVLDRLGSGLVAAWRTAFLRGRRSSVVVALLLVLGVAPALAATGSPRPAPSPTGLATPESAAELLTQRAEGSEPGSRSLLREVLRPQEPPRPQGNSPDRRPKPEPAPEPERDRDDERDRGDRDADDRDADDRDADDRDAEDRDRDEDQPEQRESEQSDEREDTPEPQRPAPIGGLNERQMEHAATIIRVGQEMGLPEQAYVVALATALQESYLRVLANPSYPQSYQVVNDGDGRDHDSVGIFQQRPISGWGTVEECMDPETSTRSFYQALQQVPGWENLPVTVAAQTVQVSAFPDHYAKHEPLARQLVDALK